jgi:hypothetical protein
VTISKHAEHFARKPVKEYAPGRRLTNPTGVVYRLSAGYDAEQPWTELFAEFLADPAAEQVPAIVIGMWGQESDASPKPIIEALVPARDRLPNLRGIFLGDITYDENEISWIQQTDVSPLLKAYPLLEYFQVRGGNGLSLGKLNHQHLRSLVVESGGLPRSVVREVAAAQLPALEHLELWLGDEGYGADATVEDLWPILDGQLFPRLRSLGLRDSYIADDVAETVALAPVLEQVRVLDLSLGTLGQRGAEALLASPAVARLEKLDIHHHYVPNELVKKLTALGIVVDAREQQKADPLDGEDRYVAVAE